MANMFISAGLVKAVPIIIDGLILMDRFNKKAYVNLLKLSAKM